MSKLPISKESLVYGTNDGGQTMKNSSPTLDHMMRQAAKMLNLKSHFGGLYEEKRIIIHSPADLEGHKAKVVEIHREEAGAVCDDKTHVSWPYRMGGTIWLISPGPSRASFQIGKRAEVFSSCVYAD